MLEITHIGSEIHALLHHRGVVSKAEHLLPTQMWSLAMNEKRAAAVLPLPQHIKNQKPNKPNNLVFR